MTKREFETFLKHTIADLPIHQQEKFLKRLQYKWMPEINRDFQEKISKKYLKCTYCNKYYLLTSYSIISNIELRKGILVYTDAGYGDDDKIADVTYNVSYYLCPVCGRKMEKDRYQISETNRRKMR